MQAKAARPPIVVYDGSKCFWKTKNTVDIMIIEHDEHSTIEVIAYEPTFNKESTRVYLDKNIVASKIDPGFVDGKLRQAKEMCLRRHDVPDVLKLLSEINNKARVDYILNRLFITEFVPETKTMTIGIQFNFRDRDEEQESSVCLDRMITTRPAELVPYATPHYQTLLAGTVNEALNALEDEKEGLRQLRASADIHEEKARKLLNIRDRWRMPIVMKKVACGRRLSINDAKIWNEVAKRLQLTEDSDVNAVIEAAFIAQPKKSADAGTDAPVTPTSASTSTSTVSPRPAFSKQKSVISVKRSMVPAAMFSQTGNAAIIKDAAADSIKHVPQRYAPTKLARQPSSSGFSGESLTGSLSAGFSAVSTSMKKRLGLNRAATTPKMPHVSEREDVSVSVSVSTTKLYRSTTAGTGAADATATATAAAPDGSGTRSTKPGVPKYVPASRKVHPSLKHSSKDSTTAAEAPLLSSRLASGLSSLTVSIRSSFSFKAKNNAIGVTAEEGAATDDISVVGELENDVMLTKAACNNDLSENTPVLTRHASVDLDAGVGQTCEPTELSHKPPSPLKSVLVPVPTVNSQDNRAEHRTKAAVVKQVKPAISPKSVAEPKATESAAARSWMSWGAQKKPAVPMEKTVSIISPRNSYNAKSPENSQRSAHPPAAVLSRAAVSYQELVEKRQQQAEAGVRVESKSSLHKPQARALRQIWSSLLGSEEMKVAQVTPTE